jgi:hypothetical protein
MRTERWTDGRTDMTKLIISFSQFAKKGPKCVKQLGECKQHTLNRVGKMIDTDFVNRVMKVSALKYLMCGFSDGVSFPHRAFSLKVDD